MDQRTREETLEKRETFDLIAADKVEGTPVYNPQGEKLGTIERIMIDKVSGKVAYAVLSFGDFLGIGDKHYPLPWHVLRYDTNKGGYVVNLDKKILESAPAIAAGDENFNWSDPACNRQVQEYWTHRR